MGTGLLTGTYPTADSHSPQNPPNIYWLQGHFFFKDALAVPAINRHNQCPVTLNQCGLLITDSSPAGPTGDSYVHT